jgi:hypothetical protein
MTEFARLLNSCGMSALGASQLLSVRHDTIKNWKQGKCNTPAGVIDDMREYSKQAKRIFKNDT